MRQTGRFQLQDKLTREAEHKRQQQQREINELEVGAIFWDPKTGVMREARLDGQQAEKQLTDNGRGMVCVWGRISLSLELCNCQRG